MNVTGDVGLLYCANYSNPIEEQQKEEEISSSLKDGSNAGDVYGLITNLKYRTILYSFLAKITHMLTYI